MALTAAVEGMDRSTRARRPAFEGEVNLGYAQNGKEEPHNNLSTQTEGTDMNTHIKEDCAEACSTTDLNCSSICQTFLAPKWVLFFLSTATCIYSLCVYGLINIVITTIELRFGLQSSETGAIVACQDIGILVAILPASYLGSRLGASKPRWIAAGLLMLGVGSFMWTLPHFLTAQNTPGVVGTDPTVLLCPAVGQHCEEGRVEQGLAAHRAIFIVAQLLHGAGAAPLISLGTTYMDESAMSTSSSVYLALLKACVLVGPAFGFFIGGSFLLLPADLSPEPHQTPSSPLWVGAWWPGFLLSGVLAVLIAFCINLYPASIHGAQQPNTNKVDEQPGLLESLKCLLTNRTFLLVALAGCGDGAIMAGLSAFLPKFLEHQFHLSSGAAAQLLGLVVVPAGGLGTFAGGWLIHRLALTRSQIIRLCIIAQAVGIPVVGVYLLGCPTPTFASPACEETCGCPPGALQPVLGSDGLSYLSPCHAGCATLTNSSTFSDCSCVEGGLATNAPAPSPCNFFLPFLAIMFVNVFITFIVIPPLLIAGMRSVAVRERSLEVGLQTIISSMVGNIPGPMLFGYSLDQACLLWDHQCGEAPQ